MKKGALPAFKRIKHALARDMIVKRTAPKRMIQLNVIRAIVIAATIRKGLQSVRMRIKPENVTTSQVKQNIIKLVSKNSMFCFTCSLASPSVGAKAGRGFGATSAQQVDFT